MKNVAKVYLGLGSNLDNPNLQLQRALQALSVFPKTMLLRHSQFYCSDPVGFKKQPDFINAVAEIETYLSPDELLVACAELEEKQNRVRVIRNGPRTLDIDIVLFGNECVTTKELTIPHPEYANRLFVLLPLAELLPEHRITANETIAERIEELRLTQKCFVAEQRHPA